MRSLEYAAITGSGEVAVAAVRSLFGSVNYAGEGLDGPIENGAPIRFRITCILPNFYRSSDATVSKDPLYVLVPDTNIVSVWPGKDFYDVRYGTATNNLKPITGAVYIYKDTAGLYFCLSPAGEAINDWGSLGI